MTADDLPPIDHDGDGTEPAIAGALRTMLLAHVDESVATDAAWTEIEQGATARRSQRSRRRTLAVAVLAAAALVGLFLVVRLEAGREDTRVMTQPDVAPDPTEGAEADSWVRLLAHVPDDAVGDGFVSIVDLRRARTLSQPMLPDPESAEAWRGQLRQMFGVDNILLSPLGPASPAELRAELGISHGEFDQVIVYNPRPGLGRYVAFGRFDPEAIAAAVAADPRWSPMLEVRQHRGVTYYRWGDDLKLYRKSPARDLGNGGRLVVGDGWVGWAYTDAEAEAIIDASLDPSTSLATVEAYRLAVEDGDAAGLTQFFVSPASEGDTSGTTVPDPLAGLPVIERPLTWWRGTAGWAPDVEQYGIGYGSEAQAAANLVGYEESWQRFATDAEVRVRQVGSSLVAMVDLPAVDGAIAPGQVSDGMIRRYAGSFALYFNFS